MRIANKRLMLCLAGAAAIAIYASFCLPAANGQTIETIAGTGVSTNNGDRGPALKINIGDPFGVEYSAEKELHICEVRNHRVWLLDGKGELRVIAGSGKKGYAGDGGPAIAAELNEPYEVRFDRAGNVLFVEMQNQIVRKVDRRTGKISTVIGNGKKGFGGDGGPATEALFSSPHSIALDGADNIYIADIGNHRIRKVDAKTGLISTIAGNGERQPPADGQVATGKPMIGPRALFITGDTLWIALREGHSVWRMDLKTAVLTHVAGTGKRGYTGDGGKAKEATFDGPKGIAIGPDNNIYVADTENNVIRRIDAKSGIIATIAGRGPKHKGADGDGGPATAASMDRPHGICVSADGAVIIGDTLTNRVRRVK